MKEFTILLMIVTALIYAVTHLIFAQAGIKHEPEREQECSNAEAIRAACFLWEVEI